MKAHHQHAYLRRCAVVLFVLVAALAVHNKALAQREFRVYPSFEGEDADAPLPDDWQVPAEVTIGRLMYPGGNFGFRGGDWTRGGTSWTDDYPRADRTLVQMLRRYTRTNVRGVEQPVNLNDGDDAFYWPFMVVGLASAWQLTDEQALKLRDYLQRGGFLFCDSFFGSRDWSVFEQVMKKVFPERHIIDMKDDHPIFHSPYDLPHMTTVQIPTWNSLGRGGRGRYSGDRAVPHWRGIEDDHGRLMVLIAHNNDVMDGWQWADDPRYPSEKANLSLQIGVNVVMYALTH